MWISTAMLIVLATLGLAYPEEKSSSASQILRSFSQPKEPQDNRGYVEQCRATNLCKKHLGHVNVFAFLDPSWYYSYRQAIMLELLRKRLEKSGFRNILFFIVTPTAGLSEDVAEDNIEVKAWREISKNIMEPEYFWGAEEAFDDLAENSAKGVVFLQDTPELSIWKSFRASKDEVVVVDRCGKLTYQVIVPWSILYFPYVKAAILSTYKEDPCGPCNEQPSSVNNSMDYDEYTFGNVHPDEKKVDKHLDSYTDQTPTNLESENVTMPSQEPKETEDDKNTSTIVHFDINLNTNITTTPNSIMTDTPFVEAETLHTYSKLDGIDHMGETISMENINDGIMNTTSINDKIESTSKVSLQQTQIQCSSVVSDSETPEEYKVAQHYTSTDEPTTVNNDNQFFTITDINTDVTRSHGDVQNAMDGSLKNMEEKENISSVDHKTLNGDTEDKERQVQQRENLPLRIILYAPHLHQEGQNLKQYTHLVLKAGSPDYHGHFHSMSTIYDQKPVTSEGLDAAKLENKKLDVYVNGVNESPGVYGEIADYWRTTEEEEFNNKNENTELLDYDDVTVVDMEGDVENTFDDESTILKPSNIGTANSDVEINDDSDDFMQRKLIKHYYKLVPWIYYIL